MYLRALLVIGLLAIGGTALATGQHDYNKNKKPCKLEVTDSPKIHSKHCKETEATPTPSQSPVVTPKPTRSPKATPTPIATPSVSPTPATTPATAKLPTVLPSVGADGR